MFSWFSPAAKNTEKKDEEVNANSPDLLPPLPSSRIRRTQEEVRHLVSKYRQHIANDPALTERCRYFWPTDPLFDGLMATLVNDIPREEDPLKEEDKQAPPKIGLVRSGATQVAGRCVEWLGLVNRDTRFASIKVRLPETGEPWLTYTNRLVVYLFADAANYDSPEDFHRQFNARPGQPFQMKCRNPVCIRLSHIAYELYSGKESADTQAWEPNGDTEQ